MLNTAGHPSVSEKRTTVELFLTTDSLKGLKYIFLTVTTISQVLLLFESDAIGKGT